MQSEWEPTEEQLAAIERREGDLLLDAGAGSGKTSVLVERFVRSVREDGVGVGAILAITFTDKAAAELRDRIRARLRELGAWEEARETEGAYISTIHGFCARVLRAGALAAGLDPAFAVLDGAAAERLADAAFDDALETVAARVPALGQLLAGYGVGPLREAVLEVYGELRSRGQMTPVLPPLAPAASIDPLRVALLDAAAAAAAELGAIESPSARVCQALDRLERLPAVVGNVGDVGASAPWPGELGALRLPGGNGAALSTERCTAYVDALDAFRRASERAWAGGAWEALGELLREFGARYVARKRGVSGLDFEDLGLLCRDLLATDPALRDRYAERFQQIMVDELQDTNAVQLALIESIARGNLFTVGDAQQSIYGFRHADLGLFEQRGERLGAQGARLPLSTNFRSRPEILTIVNAAFADVWGERFRPLVPGRPPAGANEPLVELSIADKGAEFADEGIAAPWRIAEARALAARVASLIEAGAAARDVVLLTRATTDLRAYERALEECGVPTYVIGGRGYWSHPQIVDLVAYLRALANPLDEEALYTVLASPLVGLSLDALVIIAAAGRAAGRDPWWVLREPDELLADLAPADAGLVVEFARWFAGERLEVAQAGIEELVQRALVASGYDLAMLALPGGARRLANVRKLMRLGREHEAEAGPDLRGFLELVRGRAAAWSDAGDARESEAPVEGEALDAVRLMTIHRAKGLEFKIVCVADLGRMPVRRSPLMRVGRDGARVGLRLARPGTGGREAVLAYRELAGEQLEAEAEEERRLFYVAMTRACERLILSGAVKLDPWPTAAMPEPMAWIAPAVVPDISERVGADQPFVVERDGVWVAVRFVREDDVAVLLPGAAAVPARAEPLQSPPALASPTTPPAPAVSSFSYSSLGEYARCGYRFYLERVLRLPALDEVSVSSGASAGLTGAERGTIVHALLERLDFRRPVRPTAEAIGAAVPGLRPGGDEAAGIASLIERFSVSPLCARLGAASGVRREERFGFLLGDAFVVGVLDVLAWEPGERALVVDYKSDRLEGASPAEVFAAGYETQRLIYALAALRGGASEVEVVHVFLECAEEPLAAVFTVADAGRLAERLRALTAGAVGGDFRPAAEPHRGLCGGCPGEGGLCSWPLAMTRREAPDRLF